MVHDFRSLIYVLYSVIVTSQFFCHLSFAIWNLNPAVVQRIGDGTWSRLTKHLVGCISPMIFIVSSFCAFSYLKDRFNYEYLIFRFGYPSYFAGTNNCGIPKKLTTPTNYTTLVLFNNSTVILGRC